MQHLCKKYGSGGRSVLCSPLFWEKKSVLTIAISILLAKSIFICPKFLSHTQYLSLLQYSQKNLPFLFHLFHGKTAWAPLRIYEPHSLSTWSLEYTRNPPFLCPPCWKMLYFSSELLPFLFFPAYGKDSHLSFFCVISTGTLWVNSMEAVIDWFGRSATGGTVVSALTSQRIGPCSSPSSDLSVWSLLALLVHARAFSEHSGFLP